jgi:hypothetical protein
MNDLLKPVKAPIIDADGQDDIQAICVRKLDLRFMETVDKLCDQCAHTILFRKCSVGRYGECLLDALAARIQGD